MGKRLEERLANLLGGYPRLGEAFTAGTTDGWGLGWDSTALNFYPVSLSGGGGGGAPTDAQYVTLALSTYLTTSRVLTAGEFVQLADGGAQGLLTLNLYTAGQTGGDLISMGPAGVWTRKAAGTSGHVLKTKGAGQLPEWEAEGGGGAPTDAQYVTLAADGTLTDERVLAAGDALQAVDGGAGAALTLNLYKASQAHGDVLFRGASDWDRKPAGTSGQYLTTQGAGQDPIWASPADREVVLAMNEAVAGTTITGAGGARTFSTGDYPNATSYKLVSTAMVSHAGITGHVSLYDVTNGEVIAGSTLDVTAQIPTKYASGALSTAGGTNQLKATDTAYEVRMGITGVGVTNVMDVGNAILLVEF